MVSPAPLDAPGVFTSERWGSYVTLDKYLATGGPVGDLTGWELFVVARCMSSLHPMCRSWAPELELAWATTLKGGIVDTSSEAMVRFDKLCDHWVTESGVCDVVRNGCGVQGIKALKNHLCDALGNQGLHQDLVFPTILPY